MKSLQRGRTKNESWDYTAMDITELQFRYYDYIRIGKGTHDFRTFKKIFVNQDRWNIFNKEVKEIVNKTENEIQNIDEYRRKYPEETEDRISEIRNRDYREKAEKPLKQFYGTENAILISKAEEETPIRIAEQAFQKLEKLNDNLSVNGIDRVADLDDLLNKIRDIQKIVGKIKMLID
jgi:hypothetical protein